MGFFSSFPQNIKWVAITGATDGLGYELLKILKDKNIGIIAFGRNPEKLKNLEKEFKKSNFKKFYTVELDQGKKITKLDKLIKPKIENLPSIDILINNAGQFRIGNILNTDYKTYSNYFNVNVLSCIAVTNNFLLKEINNNNFINQKMKIVGISSIFSLIPIPLCTFHSFTKNLMNNYFNYLRKKLENNSNDSICSVILMGEMLTKMNNKFDIFLEEIENNDSIKKRMQFGYVLPKEAAYYVLNYGLINGESCGHPEHELNLLNLNFITKYLKINRYRKRFQENLI